MASARTIRPLVREFRLPDYLGRLRVREDHPDFGAHVTLFPQSVPAERMATQAHGGQTVVQAVRALATHFGKLAEALTQFANEEEADGAIGKAEE